MYRLGQAYMFVSTCSTAAFALVGNHFGRIVLNSSVSAAPITTLMTVTMSLKACVRLEIFGLVASLGEKLANCGRARLNN